MPWKWAFVEGLWQPISYSAHLFSANRRARKGRFSCLPGGSACGGPSIYEPRNQTLGTMGSGQLPPKPCSSVASGLPDCSSNGSPSAIGPIRSYRYVSTGGLCLQKAQPLQRTISPPYRRCQAVSRDRHCRRQQIHLTGSSSHWTSSDSSTFMPRDRPSSRRTPRHWRAAVRHQARGFSSAQDDRG